MQPADLKAIASLHMIGECDEDALKFKESVENKLTPSK